MRVAVIKNFLIKQADVGLQTVPRRDNILLCFSHNQNVFVGIAFGMNLLKIYQRLKENKIIRNITGKSSSIFSIFFLYVIFGIDVQVILIFSGPWSCKRSEKRPCCWQFLFKLLLRNQKIHILHPVKTHSWHYHGNKIFKRELTEIQLHILFLCDSYFIKMQMSH